jgi:CRISPR-associated protein Cmr2
MVEAVRNVEEIKRGNGVLIYSGGDDILAIIPAKNSLDVLINTRKSFGAGDGHGFYVNFQGIKSVIPAIGFVGRSYCLLYGHYMHPLSLLLELSVEYLESIAKKAEWFDCKDAIFKKDTCLIAYVPRGSREAKISILPFKEELKLKSIEANNFAGSISLIRELAEDILKGEMSHGLLYRLLEEKTIWNLVKMDRRKETEKFIDSIVAKARGKAKVMDEAKKLLRFEAKVRSEEFKEDAHLLKEAIKACLSNISARRVQR